MKHIVKDNQRALLFKQGIYQKCLRPGIHHYSSFRHSVHIMDIRFPFYIEGRDIGMFLSDEALRRELAVIELEEGSIAIHLADGVVEGVLRPGKHAFWSVYQKHEFIQVDLGCPDIDPSLDKRLYAVSKLAEYLYVFDVGEHEMGLVYFDHARHQVCQPGRYYYWKGAVPVHMEKVDMRRRQIDMTGQEIMTEDKVALRLNFVCHYRVVDPVQVVNVADYENQIYILMQLALREYVGSLRLDDLLLKKKEIGDYILEQLQPRGAEMGVEFLFAGVKDIILPGEIRDILNTVLLAEKQAQANVITRREETASTRSLLNTAKLMEENATLYKLKELEFLETICDRIGSISVMGGGSLLEQLNALISGKEHPNNP